MIVKYIHDCIFSSSVHDDHEVNLVASLLQLFVKTVKMKVSIATYLIFDSKSINIWYSIIVFIATYGRKYATDTGSYRLQQKDPR